MIICNSNSLKNDDILNNGRTTIYDINDDINNITPIINFPRSSSSSTWDLFPKNNKGDSIIHTIVMFKK